MISLEWTGEYVDISDINPKELARRVTSAGINVENVISNHIDNLVIGQIKEVKDHPDSDHLHICQVDIGDKNLQIVCGAPNVKNGLKVIVALDGAILPGNFEIKKSKIRGIESNGMICALFELGLEEKTEENYNKGICELDKTAPIGKNPLEYLNLEDSLFELDVHKHRNNDCYSHIGFAYEIGTIINRPVKLPKVSYKEIDEDMSNYFNLKVETDKCPYYSCKMVKDIKIGPTPDFIKKRLEHAGMRSINNVVDISNYVMLEYGQPLHFFDADKMNKNVQVRISKEDETITTLDEIDRTLENDIVITDGKTPQCIAGIMGGLNSEITENTKNILIEAAIFDPISIRNTSNRLNLKSEASIRYSKGLSKSYTKMALDRACQLLQKYANAKVLKGNLVIDNIKNTKKTVEFKGQDINNILGIEINDSSIKEELKRLMFDYKYKSGKFIVEIPERRLDIEASVNDIAEEIGRLYGYENLVSTLPIVSTRCGIYKEDVKLRKNISKRLRSLGLNQVVTYSLISPNMSKLFNYDEMTKIQLPSPMSIDKSVFRTSILPSLLNVYDYNKKRQVNDILIYEISKVYDDKYNESTKVAGLISGNYITNNWSNTIKCDYYIINGIVKNLLDYLGFNNRYYIKEEKIDNLHPYISSAIYLDNKKIGIVGKIHPNLSKDEIYVFEINTNYLRVSKKALKYKMPPKYPSIKKDVAFILDKDINSFEVEKVINKNGGKDLVKIEVFDVYYGDKIEENKKQIAYSLYFNNQETTLTDDEVMEKFNKIIDSVCNKYNAKVRNN